LLDCQAPPVKHTKGGETLLAKATSHYAKTAYTPPKGERPVTKKEPEWHLSTVPKPGLPVEQLAPVTPNKKNESVESHYSPAAYKPARSDRPKTAPVKHTPQAFESVAKVRLAHACAARTARPSHVLTSLSTKV
jgi:hypothetical protein